VAEPTTELHFLAGAGGLLGSAIERALLARGAVVVPAVVPWDSEPDSMVALSEQARAVAQRAERIYLWWCAGAGVTATTAELLSSEYRVLGGFAEVVSRIAAGRELVFFYASSAGGVYAGSDDPPFTELTMPRPLSAYGEAKLRDEELVAGLADHKVKVAIGRIANLYGPGQDLAKQQGLVSQLCLASHRGRPLNIYVSLDTMRDYLHVDDAAERCIAFTEVVAGGETAVVTKIIASGRSVTVGAIVGEANRVLRRRVPVVMASSPLRIQQARDLRLRSVVLPHLDAVLARPLGQGLDSVRRSIEAEVGLGCINSEP
jgi:UDP-glucose 4-epimerase